MPEFNQLTEQWGTPMPAGQRAMVHRRYALAAEVADGGSILEVGCGAGLGFPLLAATARSIIGGDVDLQNVEAAKHRTQVPTVQLDAHHLPIASATFDAVLVFESIYYFSDLGRVLGECVRVLRPGGALVISTANPDRPGFHASPRSHHYPDATGLRILLEDQGLAVEVKAAFPVAEAGILEKFVLRATRVAERLHLVPSTLEGRAKIKRLVFGRLDPFEGWQQLPPVEPLVDIGPLDDASRYRTLYAIGRRGAVLR